MAESVSEWIARLHEYAAGCRSAAPLPDRDALTEAQEWQCRIVGGSILAWFRRYGTQFLQERVTLHKMLGVDRDPAIVFTSTVPGLVAAQDIIGPNHERVVYLLEDEYAAMPAPLADPEYKWHVQFWSFFCPDIEPEFAAEARAKHPIPVGCGYWQHSEGTLWAVNAGRGIAHLWRWDGHEPELLEEAMSHWDY
jgi:hypothetical protein